MASKSVADKKKRRWVASVKTDSTHPPAGLFTKSATTISRVLASKKVSPKGPGSGMRMLTYFINRAGRGLSAERRAELKRAKILLSKRITHRGKARKRMSAASRRSAEVVPGSRSAHRDITNLMSVLAYNIVTGRVGDRARR